MEELIATHPDIAENAVVGIHDELKGQVPVAVVVAKTQIDGQVLQAEISSLIRKQIGAIASLKNVYVVNRLPKTRSGKILRKTMRLMIEGKPFQIPSTIEDKEVLSELSASFVLNL